MSDEEELCEICRNQIGFGKTPSGLRTFIIASNEYLKKNTKSYYTYDYYVGGDEDTQFILTLKNNFNEEPFTTLDKAHEKAKNVLSKALQEIIENEGMENSLIVSVPRSKSYETYFDSQLFLIKAISEAAQSIALVEDGAYSISRKENNRTTHLKKNIGRNTKQGNIYKGENANDGSDPYCGITKDTCLIDTNKIRGRNIILVDDIYTEDCNVDEDCIQTLYDVGAEKVVFYAFARTVKREYGMY